MTLPAHIRLIVMGTPGFLLPTLYRMLEEKTASGEPQFDLIAVYTRPSKPKGRGLELLYSPVHEAALEIQKTYPLPFEIVTPDTFRDPENVKKFQSFKPDLVVVGAYGLILPKAILDTPPMGCLNLHASLLPYGRGASPIQRAILEGKTETGLTIMKLDEGCDTGPILKQKATPITPTTTANDLCIQLAEMGPDLLMQTLRENPKEKKQDESKATYAEKITKQEAQIDWDKPATNISCQIRAFSSVPGAFTFMKDDKGRQLRLKIYNALVSNLKVDNKKTPAGTVLQSNEKIVIACKGSALELTQLQLQDKKCMTGTEFSNGRFLNVGDQLINVELPTQAKHTPTKNPQLKKKIARRILRSSSNPIWYIFLFEEFKRHFGLGSKTQASKKEAGRE